LGHAPIECATTLHRLNRLAQAAVVEDYQTINLGLETVTHVFESSSLQKFEAAYDTDDVVRMQTYAAVLGELNGGASCVQVFTQKNPLFYDNRHDPKDNFYLVVQDWESIREFCSYLEREFQRQSNLIHHVFHQRAQQVLAAFVERVYEDVISDYVVLLLDVAYGRTTETYFEAAVESFKMFQKLTHGLTCLTPICIDAQVADRLLYGVYAPVAEEFVERAVHVVKQEGDMFVKQWDQHLKDKEQEALPPELRDAYKKSFIKRMTLKLQRKRKEPDMRRKKKKKAEGEEAVEEEEEEDDMPLKELSTLISLEMALSVIYSNKNAVRRCLKFAALGGRAGTYVDHALEQIFVMLLHTLMKRHLKPAFDVAIKKLGAYKPSVSDYVDFAHITGNASTNRDVIKTPANPYQVHADAVNNAQQKYQDVQPLLKFFELVHVADLMQQMIHVYYKEEICRFVDEHDFMNPCNTEKKLFERHLDDLVAAGLDKSITVLMDQVEFILTTEQQPTDYDPLEPNKDLAITKACKETIQCLATHTRLKYSTPRLAYVSSMCSPNT
jgi:recyclin-1